MTASVSKAIAGALAGLALMVMAACATGPKYAYAPWNATISDPGDIYSSYKWDKGVEEALTVAGRAEQIEAIKAHAAESGWSGKIAKFDDRIEHPEIIKSLKGEVIATFDKDKDTRVAVFHAPVKQNGQLPADWKLTEDIYIIVKEAAVSRVK
jgi:hypothetical protein